MNEFSVSSVSPSNIAIVKYWGKHGNQLPNNPSISFTLSRCHTETHIKVCPNSGENYSMRFLFEGKETPKFQEKIEKYLIDNQQYFGFLKGIDLEIESSNSFPHSSGIASSAASMSALVLCLLKIEKIVNQDVTPLDMRKASFLSRLASGSAARSVFPVMSLWGATPSVPDSSDDYAVPLENMVHPVFKSYHDSILIVSNKEKSVSSRVGHSLMNGHPLAEQRYATARENTERLLKVLKNGDITEFIDIAEAEALQLHEMMATSTPSYKLMEPNTMKIIDLVREFRHETKVPACFTLDAGPNVHLLYPDACDNQVKQFINDTLLQYCHDNQFIDDVVQNNVK
jgi:Mevalonate pyrophosphate decarboxylase